ncbi:hypothetical protein ACVWWJ_001997 [Luteibacter sp. HA06]
MSDQLTVYISPPAIDRGLWRVRCDGRPIEEFREEQAAIRRAAECVRMAETAGGAGIVKIELADGSWKVFRT